MYFHIKVFIFIFILNKQASKYCLFLFKITNCHESRTYRWIDWIIDSDFFDIVRLKCHNDNLLNYYIQPYT